MMQLTRTLCAVAHELALSDELAPAICVRLLAISKPTGDTSDYVNIICMGNQRGLHGSSSTLFEHGDDDAGKGHACDDDDSDDVVMPVMCGSAMETVLLSAGPVVMLRGSGPPERQRWLEQGESADTFAVVLVPLLSAVRNSAPLGALKLSYPAATGEIARTRLTVFSSAAVRDYMDAVLRCAEMAVEDALTCSDSLLRAALDVEPCATIRSWVVGDAGMVVLINSGSLRTASCKDDAVVRVAALEKTRLARQLFTRTPPRDKYWLRHQWTDALTGNGTIVARTSVYGVVDAYAPWKITEASALLLHWLCPRLPTHSFVLACSTFDPREFVKISRGFLQHLQQCGGTRCRHVLLLSSRAPSEHYPLADLEGVREILAPWTWFGPKSRLLVMTSASTHCLTDAHLDALRRLRVDNESKLYDRMLEQQRQLLGWT